MNAKLIETKNGMVAVVHSDVPVITDGQSVLNFVVNAGAYLIAVNKESITEDFFNLSTGIAGEVAQKFVNYGYRLAIYGDFSHYNSKALHAYIYECNNGKHLNFVADEDEAVRRLSQ
jgi:hypothetical protein